jgi:flavin reductase (DIM6/NTAB) family NADH-FMN oxidoreductase RutF
MKNAYRLLHPSVVFLLMTKAKGKVNVMALAWHMPVEEDKVAIAVDRENYSYELLAESKEFTLNVLPIDKIDIIWKAGTLSGRKVDKIKKLGIELEDGVKIDTPHIKGAMAFLECKVLDEIKLDEHSLFIAKIEYAWADERYFKETWLEGCGVPMHVGKKFFTTISKYCTP